MLVYFTMYICHVFGFFYYLWHINQNKTALTDEKIYLWQVTSYYSFFLKYVEMDERNTS